MMDSRTHAMDSDHRPGIPSRRILTRAVTLAILVSMCAGPSSASQASARATRDTASDVVALIQEVGSARASKEFARRVKRLGLDAIPSLFSLLSNGSAAGAEPVEMTPERETALRGGLLAQSTANLRSFLRVTALPKSSAPVRKTALSLYEAMGDAGDLKRCIALGAGDGAEALGNELRACATAMLRRDPRGHTVLVPDLARQVPVVFPYLVEAVGDAGSPAGLRFLGRVLAQGGDHDASVLQQIERIALKSGSPFAAELRDAVRDALGRDDVVAEAAARAAGALADADSVEPLCDMLGTRSARVRSTAHRALKRISGQSFGSKQARWKSWHEGELGWWREESDAVLADLAADEPARVVAAMGQVVRRRLFRDQLTGAILPLLDHPEPQIRRLACQGLCQLGSTTAVRSLVNLLTDEDDSVVREAAAALRSLSGEDLSPDPETWRAFLDERDGRLVRR